VMLASALAFTIGSSRVFLQVHFASDVLAGFAWGAAWLAVCVLSVELSRRWRLRAPAPG
jgi:membrane-associated phospholipid phosphatase